MWYSLRSLLSAARLIARQQIVKRRREMRHQVLRLNDSLFLACRHCLQNVFEQLCSKTAECHECSLRYVSCYRQMFFASRYLSLKKSFRSVLRCASIAACSRSYWSSDLSLTDRQNASSAEETEYASSSCDISKEVHRSTRIKVQWRLVLSGRDVSKECCRNNEPLL